MSLLAIHNLSLSFGKHEVVKSATLTIEKGEFCAVVGESGSGKSLTALSILGLQPPGAKRAGSIQFEGRELLDASDTELRRIRGKEISMIFQEPMMALNPLHTIGRQITEMFSGTPSPQRVEELLGQVGLSHFKDRLDAYPHQLSGGERQRVMIAMAMANGPKLLIADEPTTAVDVTIQAKILKLLKELQLKSEMSLLFITHDLTVVKRLADRVAVMKAGEIVESGKVSDIFANPQHPYTKMLLSSEPKGSAVPLATDAKPLIACEDLKVHFPIKKGLLRRVAGYVKAVDGVSVSIPQGSTLGVVGESGSGKSTLAFALLRLLASEGRIVYAGRDVQGANIQNLRKEMQVVFQDPFGSLNPRMSIREIIEEGLCVHERTLTANEREQRVDTILQEVGLSPESKDRYPHEFSGGQRQRISIARAMILRPKLLVLDEPTSALDLTVQAQIVALLKDFQTRHGLSYIFISHDLRVVRAIAHRIVVLYKGKVVEEGDTQAIFEHPKESYTKALIDAALLKETA